MEKRRLLILLAVCVAAVVAARTAVAGPVGREALPHFLLAESEQDRAKAAVRSGQVRPFPQILSAVQSRYRGRLSDARLEERRRGGSSAWIYHVKWLTPQSNLLAITVDGRTGRILGVSGRGADAARKR